MITRIDIIERELDCTLRDEYVNSLVRVEELRLALWRLLILSRASNCQEYLGEVYSDIAMILYQGHKDMGLEDWLEGSYFTLGANLLEVCDQLLPGTSNAQVYTQIQAITLRLKTLAALEYQTLLM